MTRVFVLGAVGKMCIEATRDLVETSGFDEFVLADIDNEKLEDLKKELNTAKVRILAIDASDEDSVAQAIKGYDFVMNGLSFDKSEPTVRACLKCRIPSIDLGGDFSKYSEAFEKAGLLYSRGVGMTPGVTDIMARYAADRCEKVDEIYVFWASFRPLAISPGLVMTTFWEMDPEEKKRAYYQDGEYHPQPPLRESRTVEFEPPYGKLPVYYVPHSETYTLSKLVPGIKLVKTMGTWPPIEMDFLKQLIDYGVFEKKTIRHKGNELVTLELLGDMLSQLPRGTKAALWGYALRVEVIGDRKGRKVKHVLTTSHPPSDEWGRTRAYAKNVAIPLSIGTQLIINGKAKVDKGYWSAYKLYDPMEFFKELKKRGIEVHERVEEYGKLN
jgi:saccharopine dehydrogenase-like NADP-dependent oxidoreductase